ncbi:MAG TPA: DNA-formamidopyrimidine glycosylase family protein [Saprospiraceae bacterium]|nr:DNA-formamidopyrimidine glycosylase family protein [Saprospiraceae bacterium]
MPEGPSIILLKEDVQHFAGKKVLDADGNTKTIEIERLHNKKVIEFKSWGKHFLICFKGFTVRIHFLMFGSYTVDTPKENRSVRLHLRFSNGDLYFYTCSVKILEGDINDHYDWTGDVMNSGWDKKQAKAKIKEEPDAMICDTLLNQNIFAGVGNIIKNEVLYRVRIHPESLNKKLSDYKLNNLIKEARQYSFDFLAWKRQYVLRKHWLAHTKKICARCKGPIIRKITGKFKRRSFFCPHCQPLYA